MMDYAHLVGYLHSDTLCWSYGGMAGREGDMWQQSLNRLPITEQIDAIREAGFSGIYIDWNAYLEDERIELEEILAKKTGNLPILDAEGTRAYYSFKKQEAY